MSTEPRPRTFPSFEIPFHGECSQFDSSPGGTTSICPFRISVFPSSFPVTPTTPWPSFLSRPPEQESEDQGDLLLRSQAFHAVALASSVGAEKRQQRPVQPRMHAVSDLQPFSNRLLQSSLCVVCFAIVGIDLERMSCEHCPVVAHR